MEKLTALQQQITWLSQEIQKYQEHINRLQHKVETMDAFIKEHPLPDEILNLSIRELGLSTRTINALHSHGIRQVRDIRYYSYEELQHLNGFGVFCMSELRRILDRIGVKLIE
jgi:DNA-directed RNA polymerase alpha subunit